MPRPNVLWQIDLIDFQKYKGSNRGFAWLLGIIDAFSKFVRVVPLKNKSASTVEKALRKIFEQGTPTLILSDNGGEWKNGRVQTLFKDYSIKHILTSSYTPQQNGGIERWNRTYKNILFKYFTLPQYKKLGQCYPHNRT